MDQPSRRAPARLRRARDEGGFTIPELATATLVLGVVAVAALAFVIVSANQYSGQEDRVTATDEARNALASIVRELRDADAVTLVDARTVDARVRNDDGTFQQVRYSCQAGTGGTSSCSKTTTATGASELLIDGVVNTQNFAVVSGSDVAGTGSLGGALEVRLEVDLQQAENPLLLSSAVKPRNCSPAAAGVVNPPC